MPEPVGITDIDLSDLSSSEISTLGRERRSLTPKLVTPVSKDRFQESDLVWLEAGPLLPSRVIYASVERTLAILSNRASAVTVRSFENNEVSSATLVRLDPSLVNQLAIVGPVKLYADPTANGSGQSYPTVWLAAGLADASESDSSGRPTKVGITRSVDGGKTFPPIREFTAGPTQLGIPFTPVTEIGSLDMAPIEIHVSNSARVWGRALIYGIQSEDGDPRSRILMLKFIVDDPSRSSGFLLTHFSGPRAGIELEVPFLQSAQLRRTQSNQLVISYQTFQNETLTLNAMRVFFSPQNGGGWDYEFISSDEAGAPIALGFSPALFESPLSLSRQSLADGQSERFPFAVKTGRSTLKLGTLLLEFTGSVSSPIIQSALIQGTVQSQAGSRFLSAAIEASEVEGVAGQRTSAVALAVTKMGVDSRVHTGLVVSTSLRVLQSSVVFGDESGDWSNVDVEQRAGIAERLNGTVACAPETAVSRQKPIINMSTNSSSSRIGLLAAIPWNVSEGCGATLIIGQ